MMNTKTTDLFKLMVDLLDTNQELKDYTVEISEGWRYISIYNNKGLKVGEISPVEPSINLSGVDDDKVVIAVLNSVAKAYTEVND